MFGLIRQSSNGKCICECFQTNASSSYLFYSLKCMSYVKTYVFKTSNLLCVHANFPIDPRVYFGYGSKASSF